MKSAPRKRAAKKAAAFTATLTVGGAAYTGEGIDILDALRHIPHPDKLTTKGVLVIEGESKSADFLLYLPKMQQLLKKNDIAKIIFAKWAAQRLK